MTLIVGILCQDGIVVASDSQATFGKEGIPTIGQQHITKVHILSDSIVYSSTGAVGLSQVISNEIKSCWEKKDFHGIKSPEEMMDKIGKKIAGHIAPYLQTANLIRPLVGDASSSLCKSLVAMHVRKQPCLFTFDFNGAPERATSELPFVSMGSGQSIADPFLAFLKRLLWQNHQPTLPEGRLAAIWTIDHVRLTNPGGVGGKIQTATLYSDKDNPHVLSEEVIQEHLQQIRVAEEALIQAIKKPKTDEVTPLPEAPTGA